MFSQYTQNKFLRLIAFSASTLVGTAVDTAILWLCANFVFEGYVGERVVSPTISFLCATIANFIVAYFIVWRDRISQRSTKSFFTHYAGYFGSCIGGFIIKMLFLQIFSVLLAWHVVWCNLLALCFSGLFNFVINDMLVFRKRADGDPEKLAESPAE